MTNLIKMIHGSHLYGLNTANSDSDYKGIYMPTQFEVVMGKAKEVISLSTNKESTKNTKEDTDYEIYSFPKFVSMLMKSDMVSLDMIFAPDEYIEWNPEVPLQLNPFHRIRAIRHLFVSSNMSGYLGYIRRQTAKYGQKGSRLDCVNKVIDFFEANPILIHTERLRVRDMSASLPVTEHTYNNPDKGYFMLGRCYQQTAYAKDIYDAALKFEQEYGYRARAAMENDGVDWKAVSHAYRASIQLKSAFESNGFVMEIPLEGDHRQIALDIKQGNYSFEQASEILDKETSKVESLAKGYPAKEVDRYEIEMYVYKFMKEFWSNHE